jgi:ATP-dependent DNA helicase RecQ
LYFDGMAIQHDILKRYWGFDTFRAAQEEVVQAAIDGVDTLAMLPTGGGKSLCFQVPALCRSGVCLVVSPLLALMNDQVQSLRKRGLTAHAVNSSMHFREIDRVLDNCVYGTVHFLYVSPERLQNELFQARVKKMKLSLIAVDEAHCISQWGYDFRPDYLKVGELRELFPKVPVLALTASATPKVAEDIQEKLKFLKPHVISSGFARSNLSYNVLYHEDKEGKIAEILEKMQGSAIVYCASRLRTHALADYLWKRGMASGVYHAGLTHEQRRDVFNRWMKGDVRVMCATNAFGMGIDKPDVRLVLHADVPTQPEAYFQEAGRAGRDGMPAHAALLWNESDIQRREKNHEIKFPPHDRIRSVYRALGAHLQLAIGAGKDEVFPIDFGELGKLTGLKPAEVVAALQLLSLSGVLYFDEGSYSPSRVMLVLDKSGLYSFQVAHPEWERFLGALLRMYGGLFDQFVVVRENEIATQLKLTVTDVLGKLQQLASLGVIDYEQQTDKPRITFLTARMREEDVRIPSEVYDVRKQGDEQRWYAMENYLRRDLCRSVQLLRYFGDDFPKPCGKCDVCRNEERVKHTSMRMHQLEEDLFRLLLAAPSTVEAAVKSLSGYEQEQVIEFIRRKLDVQEVVMDEKGRLCLP